MLTPETIEKMNAMKLFGLVSAFETQLSSSEYKELSFEERVGLLVDAEWTAREQRKLSRRLRAAKLRYPACLENVNFQAPRGLNREQILSLGNCRFVGERHNLLITGPTGIGKSFLACAFVERACRRGFTGCYVRAPRLLHELAVARGDGSYARRRKQPCLQLPVAQLLRERPAQTTLLRLGQVLTHRSNRHAKCLCDRAVSKTQLVL